MYSFAISLLIGAVTAVRIQDGEVKTSWSGQSELIANLADKIEEQVKEGAISVVDKEDLKIDDIVDNDLLDIPDVMPVESVTEQIESVIDQVKEGFNLINDINDKAEEKQIEKAQKKQKKEIDEVMEEANEKAAEIIESESDSDTAVEEVKEVMDDAKDEIEEINEEHDKKVSKIAKTTFVADITNDTVKDKIINEIVEATKVGIDLADIIEQQDLPFDVKAPEIVIDDEAPEEKLNRIVCRNGKCVGAIKKDIEFDGFLKSVIGQFALDRPDGLVLDGGMPMLENMGKLSGLAEPESPVKAAKAKKEA